MSAPIHITNRPLSADELMGRAAMTLPLHPRQRPEFIALDGNRRRFADRTPGRADPKIVTEGNK
jgi:hypothetical protein